MDRAHTRVSREELYRRTGIQTMPINTVYQLSAEAGGAAARAAEHLALVPDLIGLWLSGTLANELTIASTTGLLEARGRRWAADLAARLGLPRAPFGGEVVAPGFELGTVLERHAGDAGAAVGVPVRAVGAHDTASAFAAAPLASPHDAVLSSGTWSLLGVELGEPELGPDAEAFNLTNERGVGDTVRLLRNVMGLWLVQECRRVWRAEGAAHDYGELVALAGEADADVAVFDPDHDSLLHGGDMPARIAALCTGAGQAAPAGEGELVRSILVSLACKYRLVLEQLEQVTDRRIDTIHVVGGGARNELLCRLTADVCARDGRRPGPSRPPPWATSWSRPCALGELSDLADLRARRGALGGAPALRAAAVVARGGDLPPLLGDDRAGGARLDREDDWLDRHPVRIPTARPPARRRRTRRGRDRAGAGRLCGGDAVVGLRRLGHALRRLPAARTAPGRVREDRRRRRGAPAHRHRPRRGPPLPVGRRGESRRAVEPHRGVRPARRRGQPQPVPGPRLQARLDHQPGPGDPAQGDRAPAGVRADRRRARRHRPVAVAGRRDQLRRPGRPARPPRAPRRQPGRALRRPARDPGAARRVQVLRARLLRHRHRRLGLGAAPVPGARSARAGAGGPRPPRPGGQRGADRRDPGARGPAGRLSLQQPQVRRRRPHRRLGQPARAVPDLRRAERRRGGRFHASPSTSPTTSRPRSRRWCSASSTSRTPTSSRC